MKNLNENIFRDGANIFLLYSFIKKLVSKFEEWPAFKLGLIDKDGNLLKSRKDMTPAEKRDFSLFDLMVLNLKKLIEMLPGGKKRIATFAAALFLLREGRIMNESEMHSVIRYDLIIEKYIQIIENEGGSAAAVNTVGSGDIASTDNQMLFKNKLRRKKKDLQTK